jgi:TRAP-type C4-dicarboxylate transport system substrate-binding protein
MAQATKGYKLRLAASLSVKDPFIVRQQQMADRIRERTKGAVQITIFPSDTLMKAADAPKEVARGTIDMDSVGIQFYSGISDIAGILTPGFIGVTVADALRMLESGKEGRKLADEEFARLGIKILSYWNQDDIGFVSFTPLATVESFKGKRLRISGEISTRVLRALGAEPTVMAGSEAVDAMRRKIIEGSSCQPTCIVARGYMDFADWYNLWTVDPFLGALSINLKLWNGMPEDLRKIIEEEADAAAKDQTEIQATKQSQMMWKLANEHSMSLQAIKPAELAKLRTLAKPVFDDFVKKAKPQPQASRIAELLVEAAARK